MVFKCKFCPKIKVAHGRGASIAPMICEDCKRRLRSLHEGSKLMVTEREIFFRYFRLARVVER